ncbi:hypothetical protein HMPREF9069_00378 [Atopobium sp. oral taxon 810 str. F0209]|nr:hypothetical protein HMPREF9069_00378 [Atopobium sp. oral taxon 810 str. F0209]
MKGLSLWGEGPQPRPGLNNSSQKKILNREAQDAYSYCKNYCLNHLGPLSFLTIKVIHGLLIAVKHNSQKLVGIEESFHMESCSIKLRRAFIMRALLQMVSLSLIHLFITSPLSFLHFFLSNNRHITPIC